MHQRDFVELLRGGDFEALRHEIQQDRSWVRREFMAEFCPEGLGRGRGGNRALALACFFGRPSVIDLLLAAGADPSHRNEENRTAFHVALEHNYKAAEHLARIGMERDVVACACLRDLKGLRKLLEQNPSLASDASTGLSVLGWATYYGARESAELLLEFGAQPDQGELQCAAGIANVEMGELLLRHGADIEHRASSTDWTALHVAAAHLYASDTKQFVDMLLENGADRRARAGERGLLALDIARAGQRYQKEQEIAKGDPRWKNFAGVVALLERS